jgi:hypothetical protein
METNNRFRPEKLYALGLTGIVTVFISGCAANLQSVGNFAKISSSTSDYQQIVKDYADTPKILKRYSPDRMAGDQDIRIEEYAQQKKQLENVQTILAAYMSALGDLAVDNLPNVDDRITGITGALTAINPNLKAITDPAGEIAKVLIREVGDHWRQSKIKTIIRECDPHVQSVIAGLKHIIDIDMRAALDVERKAITDTFDSWKADARSHKESVDGAQRVARVLKEERLNELAARSEKLDAYIKILDTIAKGHADLYKNIDKLDEKALTARLQGYSKDLLTIQKNIAKLTN